MDAFTPADTGTASIACWISREHLCARARWRRSSEQLRLPLRPIVGVPTVTSLSPSSGTTGGGASVTISGSNFVGVSAVSFGSTPASGFVVNSNSTITATSPAESAGTVNVVVTTSNGASVPGVGNQYVYSASGAVVPNAPSVINGITVPTNVIFDDEFVINSSWASNQGLNPRYWSPVWAGGNGNIQNGSPSFQANISVQSDGVHLTTDGSGGGATCNTNPDWVPGGGLTVAPTVGHPLYVEYKCSYPGSGTQGFNWPSNWMVATPAEQGAGTLIETDIVECFGLLNSTLIYGQGYPPGHSGPPCFNNPNAVETNWISGFHTYGVLLVAGTAASSGAYFVFFDGTVSAACTYTNATPSGGVLPDPDHQPHRASVPGHQQLLQQHRHPQRGDHYPLRENLAIGSGDETSETPDRAGRDPLTELLPLQAALDRVRPEFDAQPLPPTQPGAPSRTRCCRRTARRTGDCGATGSSPSTSRGRPSSRPRRTSPARSPPAG